ncbi:MAG: hypothetical protein EB168_09705, partial [Euryarchaeota archaeon]|nr:hypothetical protein [Euryarchaeota archaeon]
NAGYNRDSYTSDLVGEDSYTLMPKWYIDSAVGASDLSGFVKLNETNTQTAATTIDGLTHGSEFTFAVDAGSTGGGFRVSHGTNTGLLYTWSNTIRTSQIASADNEILNRYAGDQRYAFKSRIVQVGDSDPTVVGSSLYDSFGDSNNLWWQPTGQRLSVRVNGAWQQINTASSGSVTVDSVAPSPATNGELWYDPTTSVLHIRDSGAWDSINAQDSGAYLLLTGGTVTGPLNLDSGGVQLGPEGGRLKLIAGAYSRVETWTSGENAWDSAIGGLGGAGVEALAYDPDTNILIAASRAFNTIYWSDDNGVSWNRSTDSAGNNWSISDQIRNAYYIPEVKRWFASDTRFNSLWMSDNGKDNWRQPAYDSVNSTEPVTEMVAYEINAIYDDSLNPVLYGTYGGLSFARSFDSGSTWSIINHHEIGFDSYFGGVRNTAGIPFYSKRRRLSKSAAYVDDGSSPSLMYSSTDGRNWTKLADSSPGIAGVTKIFTLFDSDLDTVINVGEDENTYWSDDFGVTWNLSKIIGINDSGEFDLRVYDMTKTETGAYYALAFSDSYGNGGYTSTDLKEWHLVDRHPAGVFGVPTAVERLGDGEYVRATDVNG